MCCGFSVPRASSGGRRPWTRWPSEKPSASSESSRGRQCRCGWGRYITVNYNSRCIIFCMCCLTKSGPLCWWLVGLSVVEEAGEKQSSRCRRKLQPSAKRGGRAALSPHWLQLGMLCVQRLAAAIDLSPHRTIRSQSSLQHFSGATSQSSQRATAKSISPSTSRRTPSIAAMARGGGRVSVRTQQ